MSSSTCPSCSTEVPDGARFCFACGTALARSCPSCGADAPPAARFCMSCGTALDDAVAPPPVPPPEPVPPPAAARQPEEERRQVTVLFADLSGYTAVAERMDPEAVKRLIDRTLGRLKLEVDRHGGTVDKFIGDNVMAVFGAPVAHEDDAERAVRAALGMQRAMEELNRDLVASQGVSFQLRVGLNTGEVLAGAVGESYTVIGDAVNVAARLQAAGRAGGVTVGERTYRATRHAVEYTRLEPLTLKGKSEPVEAWEATGLVADQPAVRPRQAEAELVGRVEELRMLAELQRRTVRESRAHLLTVVGEAGVGKSRLLREAALRLTSGEQAPVLRQGRCLPYGAGVVYWALGEVVRDECGIADGDPVDVAWGKLLVRLEEIAGLGGRDHEPAYLRNATLIGRLLGIETPESATLPEEDPQKMREAFFSAVRAVVEGMAAQRPLVLAFEDIHWADDGMLDLIEHLARSVRAPVLVVCLTRDELLERRPAWGSGRRTESIAFLEPLDGEDARELVASLLPGSERKLAGELAERAGGNPLFAEELVRRLVRGGLLRRHHAARLRSRAARRAPRRAQPAPAAAAPARGGGGADLLAGPAAPGGRGRGLRPRRDAGRARGEGPRGARGVGPAHGRARAGLQARADPRRRLRDAAARGARPQARRGGVAAGGALGRPRRRGRDPALRALRPRRDARARGGARPRRAGGDRAPGARVRRGRGRRRGRPCTPTARRSAHYARARELAGGSDPEAGARIAEKHGDLALRLAQPDVAIAAWAIALEHRRERDEPERIAALLRKTGIAHAQSGERERAVEHLQQGINLLKDGEPTLELVRLYEEAAWLYINAGENMLAIYAAEKALRLAERLGETRAASRAHGIFGRVFGRMGDTAQARRNLERAVELARGSERPGETILALTALGHHLEGSEADYAEAQRCYAEALALAERVDDVPAQIDSAAGLAWLAVYRADWKEVERWIGRYADLGDREDLAGRLALPLVLRGILRWREGDWVEAERLHRRAHELAAQAGWSEDAYYALYGLAATMRDRGDYGGAAHALDQAIDGCERAGLLGRAIQARAARAVNERFAGREEEARASAAEAFELSQGLPDPAARAAALEAVGVTADPAEAPERLREAFEAWSALGRPLDAARCDLALGRVLGEGSPEGVAALERAGDAFERLGVAHLAGQARGLARA